MQPQSSTLVPLIHTHVFCLIADHNVNAGVTLCKDSYQTSSRSPPISAAKQGGAQSSDEVSSRPSSPLLRLGSFILKLHLNDSWLKLQILLAVHVNTFNKQENKSPDFHPSTWLVQHSSRRHRQKTVRLSGLWQKSLQLYHLLSFSTSPASLSTDWSQGCEARWQIRRAFEKTSNGNKRSRISGQLIFSTRVCKTDKHTLSGIRLKNAWQ